MDIKSNKLSVMFEDLDDRQKTMLTFLRLCNFLVERYAKNLKTEDLEYFVLSSSNYFGYLLTVMGYNEEENPDDGKFI